MAEETLPFGAGTSYLLGTTLMEQGDYQQALPYLHHAYRLAGEMPEIGRAYLETLLNQGYRERALEVVDKMLSRDPDDAGLREQRIFLLAQAGDAERALREIDELHLSGRVTAETRLLEGQLLSFLGRFDDALRVFRQAMIEWPGESERIYLSLAGLLQQMERFDELDRLWAEAAAELPDSRDIRIGWLRYLVQQGRFAEARSLAGRLEARSADSESASDQPPGFSWEMELANILIGTNRPDQAVLVLEERLQRDELDLAGGLWLVRLLRSLQRDEESIALLQRLTETWPTSGLTWLYLGESLAVAGDLESAEDAVRRAVQIDSLQVDFNIALLRILALRNSRALATERPDSTERLLRDEVARLARHTSALVEEDQYRNHMILGFAFRGVRDLQSAAEHFESAAAGPEERTEALLQLSICADEMGDPEHALGILEDLRREQPNDANVANSLGYYLAERNRELGRAESLISQALADEPENGAYLDSLAWVYFRQGRLNEAFDLVVRAANALPDDPTILEHLGRVLHALGKTDEALRAIRRAVLAGANPDSLAGLIERLESAQQKP